MTDLVTLLARAPVSLHVCAAGAGYALLQALTARPGASAFLSGATLPYSSRETDAVLGYTPKSYVSEDTALELAMLAYLRAAGGRNAPLGIGITAALTSSRPHRGGERAFVAVVSERRIIRLYRGWQDTGDSRSEQDASIAEHIADLLEEALAEQSWDPETDRRHAADAEALLLARPYWQFDGRRLKQPDDPGVLLSGAFNPVHAQHLAMKSEVEENFGEHVTFHLELTTPHKPALRVQDVLTRLAGLRHHTALLTRGLPLYLDRARAFPEAPMILGTDALERMLDPRWGVPVRTLLTEFAQLGTRFYVSPRIVEGQRLDLATVLARHGVDPDLDLFYELECSSALSSTALRQVASN